MVYEQDILPQSGFLDNLLGKDIGHLAEARAELAHMCDWVEQADQEYRDKAVMARTMQAVFDHLRPHVDTNEQKRFDALENAAAEIAAHIDVANISNRPSFHNRGHFLFVQICGRIIDQLNNDVIRQLGHEMTLPVLSPCDMACSAVIDLLHDLDHTGETNGAGENYQPMKLESMAIEHAMPILQEHGVGQSDINMIRAAVLASDPGLPKEIMRGAYDWHFTTRSKALPDPVIWMEKFSGFDPATQKQLAELTSTLYGDQKAAFLAARLGDADLFASFGMDEGRSRLETQKLDEEFHENGAGMLCDEQGNPLPQARLFALLKILGGRHSPFGGMFEVGFTTPGAQLLGGDNARQFQEDAQQMLGVEGAGKLYQMIGLRPGLTG